MKVILTEDVKSVGKKGEVVTVNDGYARNVIIKKNMGIEATGKNLNDWKLKNANQARIAQEHLEEARTLGEQMKKEQVNLSIKTGEGGKAFGSVSNKEIAEAIKAQLGHEVDKKKVILKETLKAVGVHEVPVKLHKDVTVKLKVNIEEA